ncbi:MAG TPA: zinc ABC transporter substrate-binding protein [Candidatus Limnocylindrales bacterium]|nr:zinc ABC transporter substrate-binding protein [Candidatus Limnocylindrales bacterium]
MWRVAAVAILAGVLAGCGSASSTGTAGHTLQVLAAENFWGSIAAQLGGSHVQVTSIVTNPNADPHEYESNTADARAFATADYVILNGAGYDDWATRLLAANPNPSRKVFTVADLLGKKPGDNPHFWYNPSWVEQVADRITADYKAIDGADASAFDQQRAQVRSAFAPYHARIAAIKSKFPGVKVGATESIFVYLAQALSLDLISPPAFMQAVAEGNDPPAQTVAAFHDQVQTGAIKVLVYNVQTATAVTTNLRQLAVQQNIPVVGISETLQPPDATFQDWQLAQLLTLENALNAGALTQ